MIRIGQRAVEVVLGNVPLVTRRPHGPAGRAAGFDLSVAHDHHAVHEHVLIPIELLAGCS